MTFRGMTFVGRFDAIVRDHGACIAVEVLGAEGESLERVSYGELDERVNRAARAYARGGVGPGSVISLRDGRSLAHVVGMLALWRVGAAFAPIDRDWPDGRIAEIEGRLRDAPAREDTHDAENALAYVIASSGSTGAPKLIAVGHRGLVPMLDAQIAALELGPRDRCLWMLSSAFDASISDVGVALLSGACLCVAPEGVAGDPVRLTRILRRAAVTYVDLPPPLLAIVDPATLPSLRTVLVGGEPPPARAVERWARAVRLFVAYGPTEATVCTHLARAPAPAPWARAWIGEPLLHVRDRIGDPLAREPREGELWLAGSCLARGYVGDEALEQARFVTRDGQRWFCTGDRVRRHEDGRLEFLGRLDRQVKIDGKLAAPEEVETVLAGEAGVRRAHVLAHGKPLRLTAFVEADPASVSVDALRAALTRALPGHLVPSHVEVLDAFPILPSGKVDGRRLAGRLDPPRSGDAAKRDGRRGAELPDEASLAWLVGVTARAHGSPVGADDDLAAHGLGSLGAVSVLAALAALGHPTSPERMRRERTLRRTLAASQRGTGASEGLSSRVLEARLAPLLSRLPAWRATSAHRDPVLVLTGATGLLGGHLARALLGADPRTRIVALVRARDDASARARLRGVPATSDETRVEALAADLAAPRLGLGERAHAALAARATGVIHAAAETSVVASLEDLEGANVLGTLGALAFAREAGASFDHVSTLSVFVSTDRPEGVFREDDELTDERAILGGYAQSKWLAERLVRLAAGGATAPVRVHRLGLLTGARVQGSTVPADWLARTLRGLAALGCVPEAADPELAMDVTPVSWAADALARLAGPGGEHTGSFHLRGASIGLRDLVQAIESTGLRIARVDAETFRRRARSLLMVEEQPAAAVALLALARALDAGASSSPRDLFQATRAHFDTTRASVALARLGLAPPTIDEALLARHAADALVASSEAQHS